MCIALFDKFPGSYNKAFRLTLDNSLNVIARIPCPLAGPSYMVTASEVATLEFAREVLRLPVPRVITWSGDRARSNKFGVGADFIIMEEAPGVAFTERWSNFQTANEVTPALNGLLHVESKFGSLRFSRIGSIYFKEDVSPDQHDVPLLTGVVDDETLRLSEKYRIGPLMNYQWWRGGRAHMPLDRGPCTTHLSRVVYSRSNFSAAGRDATSFFRAAAENELAVLAQQTLSLSQYRRKPTHDFATHSKLLSMYLAAVPHFVPTTDNDVCAPTLWHPDLTLNNVFVSESGIANIEGLIDWQHATVLPYFMFASLPPAVVYEGDKIDLSVLPPALPSNFDELSAKEQEEYRLQLKFANRHMWYQFQASRTPRRRSVTSLPQLNQLVMLPAYVTRAWVNGVFDLREALVCLRDNWASIAGPGVPCPVEFSSEEMVEHEKQLEAFRSYENTIAALGSALRFAGDGWVTHENYDFVREQMGEFEQMWNEELTGMPFPLKDGEHSFFLS